MQSTAHDWLYAIGDANGRVLLTHMGKYQGRMAADHILGKPVELRSDGAQSPRVIFTDPQVAAVGHTEAGAREAGLNIRVVEVGSGANAGGSFYGRNAPGTARIVVDEDRRIIVGATFTGPDIGEFIHAATIAVIAEVPLERLLARRAELPHAQRAVAAAARALWTLTRNWSTGFAPVTRTRSPSSSGATTA